MPVAFQDMLADIGEAAMHVQRMAATAAIRRWRDMCDEGDDGVLTPKQIQVKVDEDKVVGIPEISMAHPSVMPLEELKVKFEAEVDMASIRPRRRSRRRGAEEQPEGVPKPQLKMTTKRGLFKKSTHFEVEALFRLTEPPESIEALRDTLANQVKDALNE